MICFIYSLATNLIQQYINEAFAYLKNYVISAKARMFWGHAHGFFKKTTVTAIPKFKTQLSVRTVSYVCFTFILDKMHYPEIRAQRGLWGTPHRFPD